MHAIPSHQVIAGGVHIVALDHWHKLYRFALGADGGHSFRVVRIGRHDGYSGGAAFNGIGIGPVARGETAAEELEGALFDELPSAGAS